VRLDPLVPKLGGNSFSPSILNENEGGWTRKPSQRVFGRVFTFLILSLSALTLAGCLNHLDPDTLQPRAMDTTPPIYAEQTLGQTFVAARPGLLAIQFQLATQDAVGAVVLRLKTSPDSNIDLRTQEIDLAHSNQSNLLWEFPPLADSQGQAYYVSIQAPRATPEHPLSLRSVAHDVYRPGNLYVNGVASSGDLAFSAFYDYDLSIFWNDVSQAARNSWLVIPALVLFLCPGFLLMRLARMDLKRYDFWQRIALALGTSLAIIPLILLWVTELGGAISPLIAQLVLGSAGVASVVILGRDARRFFSEPARSRKLAQSLRDNAAGMLFILALGLGVRLIASRDLIFPQAVDSIHNYILTRLIADTGQVPLTYAPYVPDADPTYHFGFHASIAAFAGLSGMNILQTLLLIGQLFNGLMALQVYLLARWLTGRTRVAWIAALIVAVISTMPAYNINWGHDTELGGWLILPVAIIVSLQAAKTRDLKMIILAAIIAGGLTLTHYRVFAFYICFGGAWWLVDSAKQVRSWRARLYELGLLASISLLGLILLMPWLLSIVAQLWFHALDLSVTAPHHSFVSDFSWDYVTAGFDGYLLLFAVAGVVIALAARHRFSFVLLVWLAELFVISNIGLFGLPGQGMIDNMSVLTMWFIPVSIGCGFLADEFIISFFFLLPTRWRVMGMAGLIGLATILVIVGSEHQIQMVNSQGILATDSDRQALAWIENNISPHSHFLINAQTWVPTIYAGTDGGFWITPLTKNGTTAPPIPPSLYALREMPRGEQIQEFYRRVDALASDPAGLWTLLHSERVGYVYVGALGGSLDPQLLLASPNFRKIYDNRRVYIFKVVE